MTGVSAVDAVGCLIHSARGGTATGIGFDAQSWIADRLALQVANSCSATSSYTIARWGRRNCCRRRNDMTGEVGPGDIVAGDATFKGCFGIL